MLSSTILALSSCISGTLARPQSFQNFVVARAYLESSGSQGITSVAYYDFVSDSTLTATYWVWHQANGVKRAKTGSTPDASCTGAPDHARPCEMQIPDGWQHGGETAGGHYDFNEAGQLVVNWGGGADETWCMVRGFDATAGAYASFSLCAGQHFNYGLMVGSNAPFEAHWELGTINGYPNQPWAGVYTGTDQFPGAAPATWNEAYTSCAASPFLTERRNHEYSPTICHCDGDPDYFSGMYVQKLNNRKDAQHNWCECLSHGELCYDGHSHVKPMLQAVDTNGNWLGHVGVEASDGVSNGFGIYGIGEAVTSIWGVGEAMPNPVGFHMNHTVTV